MIVSSKMDRVLLSGRSYNGKMMKYQTWEWKLTKSAFLAFLNVKNVHRNRFPSYFHSAIGVITPIGAGFSCLKYLLELSFLEARVIFMSRYRDHQGQLSGQMEWVGLQHLWIEGHWWAYHVVSWILWHSQWWISVGRAVGWKRHEWYGEIEQCG
jgi:hypothetical protein